MEPTGNYDSNECGVCLGPYKNPHLIAQCGHSFCKVCIDKLPKNECPGCRGKIEGIYKNFSLISCVEQNSLGAEDRSLAGGVTAPEAGTQADGNASTPSESTSTSSLSSLSRPVSTEIDVLTAEHLLEDLGGQLNGHLSLLDFERMKPLFPVSMHQEWNYIMHDPALREHRLLVALFQRRKLHVLLHALREISYDRLVDRINDHNSAPLFNPSESTSTSSLSSPSRFVSTKIDVLTAQYFLEELGSELNGHLFRRDFEKMKPFFPVSMQQEWDYIMHQPALRARRLLAALFQRRKLHVLIIALQKIGYDRLVDLINAHDSAELFKR